MKKLTLISLFYLLLIGVSFAQRPGQEIDRERLQAARVAFITTRLDLSPEQAEKFWPVFNEYDNQRESNLKKLAALNPGRDVTLSEEEAKKNVQQRFEIQRQMIADEEKFVLDISKTINYNQILKLNRIARDFTRHIYQRQRQRNTP
ncbi:hypothetical protein [Algoriphagus sp. CAU 1675]|uniref:hypothetical protein n=1 Tax=Algoriphagus sp. CAU 1675 TaxID=3032597 RepID=UPI0023D98F1B|nr:hypothetical protein [Algoriphagus sp. CAU 1675]MDF2158093.1 hypothetical protein [Algoriphagus sp. CAU 1675]